MILKHTDDDGDLSIFAAGNEILFACKKGHYWVVDATGAKVPRAGLRAANDMSTDVSDLARFGSDAIDFMSD